MRTITEIQRDVENSLQSNTWKELKTSLLGKELISYATQLIYKTEVENQALVGGYQLTSMDESSYYALAHACDVPLYRRMPSTIKIKIKGFSGVIRPYQACVSIGTNSFYNIEFVTGDEVTLYQGVLKTVASNEKFYSWGREFKEETWSEYVEFTESMVHSKYVKLSEYAYPNSVRVMEKNGTRVYPMTWYEPALSGSEEPLYKVRVVRDGNVAVVFGNGVWGKVLQTPSVYEQIFYLDGTKNPFRVDSIKTVSLAGMDGSATSWQVDVIATQEGYDCQLTDLRDQVIVGNAQVITTKQAITKFLNLSPYVVDSQVVSDNTSDVICYIKPAVQGMRDFTDLQVKLQQKADACTFYILKKGAGIVVKYIAHYKDVSIEDRSTGTSYLQENYPYESTGFSTDFSVGAVKALLSEVVNGYFYITMSFTEKINATTKLLIAPIEGTLKIPYSLQDMNFLNGGETRYMIEDKGLIKKYDLESQKIVDSNIVLGAYAIYENSGVFTVLDIDGIANGRKTYKICLNDHISELSEMGNVKALSKPTGDCTLYCLVGGVLKMVEFNVQDFDYYEVDKEIRYVYREIEGIPLRLDRDHVDDIVEDYVLARSVGEGIYLCACKNSNKIGYTVVTYKLNYLDNTAVLDSEHTVYYPDTYVRLQSPYTLRMLSFAIGFGVYSNVAYAEEFYDGFSVLNVFVDPRELQRINASYDKPIFLAKSYSVAGRVVCASAGGDNNQLLVMTEEQFKTTNFDGAIYVGDDFYGDSIFTGNWIVVSFGGGIGEQGYEWDESRENGIDITKTHVFSETTYHINTAGSIDYNTGEIVLKEPQELNVSYETNRGIPNKEGIYFALDSENPLTWEEIQ